MILHPIFDTGAKVFVVTIEGNEVEAKSISALLAMVGPGYTVRDYYPCGVPATLLPRGSAGGPDFTRHRLAPGYRPKHGMPPERRSEPAGEVLAEKAPKEPPKRKSRSRASKALPAPIPPKPKREATPEERAVCCERDNAILDAWAAGETGPDLARRFNMSTSAIGANLIPKARLRGDPRAVVRNSKMYGSKVNKLTGSRYR